ncbi:MAG: trypsin-like peptidase domain-containing protein [Oscillospiraceae bacterium]|nr:trypsin-like peptidase domain-containing protein [Oscillospiraceae bacterium]
MKKRIISIFLCLVLALLIAIPALGAMTLSNFRIVQTYDNTFRDVSGTAWYYPAVKAVYERGLMVGRTENTFEPAGLLTIAETIKLAASLHKGYHTGSMHFPVGEPWYSPYFEYALQNNIPVGAFQDLNVPATRSDFAVIIAGSLPPEAITPINRIADGSIPDVWESFSYGPAVYRLYRAGVLTGMDDNGTFFPGRTLMRREAATILARVVDANLRVSFSLFEELTAEQIYKMASPAVFLVQAYDANDNLLRRGSGFFIDPSGIAATNYHVIVGAHTIRLLLDDGETVEVSGLYDYNTVQDTAIMQAELTEEMIAEGRRFPYLLMADSDALQTGATVFALGSPLGLQASFSRGIVSQSIRWVDEVGTDFIQLDAAISSGSSGGAVLDTSGRVVGVTAATHLGGQNINLAVPINYYKTLSLDEFVPFATLIIEVVFYEMFSTVPDFGALFDIELFELRVESSEYTYLYLVSDLPDDPDERDEMVEEYMNILEQNGFQQAGRLDEYGVMRHFFFRPACFTMLILSFETLDSIDCFVIAVR